LPAYRKRPPSGISGVCSDVACRVAVIIMPHRDPKRVASFTWLAKRGLGWTSIL